MFGLGMEYLVILGIGILAVWYYQKWKKRERMPPGPSGYPLMGNILQFDINNPLKGLAKWKKEFGDIFKINLVGQDVVVVSSYELMKDVLITKQDVFSGRPTLPKLLPYFRYHEDVIVASTSPTWKIKKKAMLTSLKMYGEELLRLEKITLECIQETLQMLEHTKEKPFNPSSYIHSLVEQILAILLTGSKLPEEQTTTLIDAQNLAQERHFSPTGPGVELEFFPWLRHFGHPVAKEIEENASVMWNIYTDMIQRRKTEFDATNPECLLDGLFVQQAAEKSSGMKPVLTDDILVVITMDLFEAGVNTTKWSTLALIAIIANNPDIQEKIQKEIDVVIGNNEPRLQDRQEMHYTSACLHELIRYVAIAPFLIPHMATKDAELNSFIIPKGTQIWCNVWELNHDPRFWEDPWTYKPERFLDEQGRLVLPDHPNRRRILNFGAGKRICAGEVLAKNRIFLFTASLFQKFKFIPTKGQNAPNHDPKSYNYSTAGLMINDYDVMARPRSMGEY